MAQFTTKENQNEKRTTEVIRFLTIGKQGQSTTPAISRVFKPRLRMRYRLQITICSLIARRLSIT
jgi:hypothetical protein